MSRTAIEAMLPYLDKIYGNPSSLHSVAAGKVVKEEGGQNDLVDRIAGDPMFGLTKEEILAHMDPAAYIGRCPAQVEEFDRDVVEPIRRRYQAVLSDEQPELSV